MIQTLTDIALLVVGGAILVQGHHNRRLLMATQADVQALADRVIALGPKIDAAIAGDAPPLDLGPVDAAIAAVEAKFATPPADSTST